MADFADLYPGFASRSIETSAGKIFARVNGAGRPPLLLLHGHPQSNVMWQHVLVAETALDTISCMLTPCRVNMGHLD
jgi:haloacetate dehalogenase